MLPLSLGQQDPEEVSSDAQLAELVSMTPTRAAYEQAWEDTPFGSIARMWGQSQLEELTARKLTIEDANKQYPGMNFEKDVNPYVAQMMFDRKQHREKLARIVQAAPDTLYGTLSTFAGSSLAHMADPINFGAGLAIGAGARFIGLGAEAGAGAGRVFAQSVGENFVGNLAADSLNMYASKLDGKEFDAGESLLMNAVTSVAFAGLHTGIHAITSRMNERLSRNILKSSSGAAESGLNPEIAPALMRAHLAAETSGTSIPYTHEGFNPLTPHYSAAENGLDFKAAQIVHPDGRPGKGITLTDNPNAAHGAAARAESDVTGNVFTHDISQLNILDGHGPIPESMLLELESFTGERLGTSSLKDVMDIVERKVENGDMDISAYAKVEDMVEAAGYDGHQYATDRILGEEHAKQTMVKVYDKEKVIASNTRLADVNAVGKVSPEKLAKIAKGIEASPLDTAHPSDLAAIDSAKPTAEVSHAAVLADAEKSLEPLNKALEFENHMDAEDVALLDQAKALVEKAKKTGDFVKRSLGCMIGG